MLQLLQPWLLLAGLVFFALLRWIDAFAKSAASQAGRSFGETLARTVTEKAQSRFGITGTAGLVALSIIAILFIGGGVLLAVLAPDCESQNTGFVLAAGGVGLSS
jgi:hypothetical protein